ncbi:DUF4956 domain-containing protein [Microbacterium lacticum]
MTVSALALAGVDLVAAILLTAVYYRRHRRRDLVVAFLGVNVGVLAVAAVLGTAEVALGLGLGLFGVLSIIRLRSSEITQREVAYYFAALAIGLICGLPHTDLSMPVLLVALIVAVLAVADHPRLLPRARHQLVHLDRAIAVEEELRAGRSHACSTPRSPRSPCSSSISSTTRLWSTCAIAPGPPARLAPHRPVARRPRPAPAQRAPTPTCSKGRNDRRSSHRRGRGRPARGLAR